jgi:hypothetical protein
MIQGIYLGHQLSPELFSNYNLNIKFFAQELDMPFRFHRSLRLFPGIRLNFGKRGLSVSAGAPGATINFSKNGTMLTVGVPGTGLSFRQQLNHTPDIHALDPPSQNRFPSEDPSHSLNLIDPSTVEIRSAELATLSSPDLIGLKLWG